MWKKLTFLAAILLAAGEFHAAERWTPRIRPDRAFGSEWVFLGCESKTIEPNCWVGDIPGHVCRWRRTSTAGSVVREELYRQGGEFYLAYERPEDGAEEYRIIFRDHGRTHLRLSERPGRDGLYVAEVVANGVVTARYASSWDRIFATEDGEVSFVPMDTRRLRGKPYPPIETLHARQDELEIQSLRMEHLDLSQPQSVEFGFWFEGAHRAAASKDCWRWAAVGSRPRSETAESDPTLATAP